MDVAASATATMMSMTSLKEKEQAAPPQPVTETVRKLVLDQTRANNAGHAHVLQGVRMAVPYAIHLPTDAPLKKVKEAIEECFDMTERTFSPFFVGSELYELNQHSFGVESHPFPLSDSMWEVLMYVDFLHRVTGGLFDPTWAGVQSLWSQSLRSGLEPARDEVRGAAEESAGWGNVILDPQARTAWKRTNLRLDLCGLTKGWCVDRIVASIQSLGVRTDFCVDWGGDSMFVGGHPIKRPWVSGIVRPPPLRELFASWQDAKPMSPAKTEYLHSVRISAQGNQPMVALATSGDYNQLERFGYFHIFHPVLRRPMKVSESSVASATVASHSCMVADALATCLILCGRIHPALEFIRTFRESEPPGGSKLLTYFLYAREGGESGTFVHDEGEGQPYRPTEKRSERKTSTLGRPDCMESRDLVSGGTPASASCVRDMMRCMPTLYSVAVSSANPPHIAVLSSTVQWCSYHSPKTVMISLNLMKNSELYKDLRDHGQRFAVHILTSGDVREGFAIKDYGDQWLTTHKIVTTTGEQWGGVRYLEALSHNLHVCEIVSVADAGDHSFVTAKVVDSRWPLHTTPLVHMHRKFFTLRVPSLPVPTTVWPYDLVTPVVAVSPHGLSCPCVQLRCCSLKPPMVSFLVWMNSASKMIFGSSFEGEDGIRITLNLVSDETDMFHGNLHAMPTLGLRHITVLSSFTAVTISNAKCDERSEWAEDGFLQIIARVEKIDPVSSQDSVALTYSGHRQARLLEVH